MKTCNKCGEEKQANTEYFYRNKKMKDGLFNTCKECKKEYNKKYREENKKHYREYSKKYYEENKEHYAEYYQENKEKKLEYRRKYYEENKEHYAEYYAEYGITYRLENSEVIRLNDQRRRARMAQLPHTLTLEEWEDALEFFNYSCAYCGISDERLHQEHVIPVVKGGGYTADNIIPACGTCNASKHARNMEEWYSEQEFFNIGRFILLNEWIEAGIGEAERVTEEGK